MRVWLVLCLAACQAQPHGTQIILTSPDAFDHLELFFGGSFERRTCGDASMFGLAPRTTPAWSVDKLTFAQQQNIHAFRRQFNASDVLDVAATTTFTVELPTQADPSEQDFVDILHQELIVVASAKGKPVRFGHLEGFDVPDDEFHQFIVPLDPIGQGEIEVWGLGSDPACVRWSDPGGATTFVVREWDHDCDGLQTVMCPAPGQLDDCDPQTFCDPTDATGCAVVGGCTIPDANGTTSEQTCHLGTCTNHNGARACEKGQNGTDLCVGADACTAGPCDRAELTCAMSFGDPDATCDVPVDGTGALCGPTTLAMPLPCDTAATDTPVVVRQRAGFVAPGFTALANGADAGPCAVSLVASQTPLPMGEPAGFMPDTTRLLVQSITTSGGPNMPSSFLAELHPVPGDCTDALSVTCDPATAMDPDVGTEHVCSP